MASIKRKMAWKLGKAEVKLVRHALSSKEPRSARYLKYGFFALVGLAIGILISRSGREDSSSVPSSSEEENKAVIRRWIEAYNERDLEAEADVLAPGYVAHVPGAPGPLGLEGLEAWRQFTAPFTEAFPDLRLTVEDIMAEGEMVAARVAFHGTHRGEFQGIPPTDKEVAFSEITIDRVVDGKVEEHWFEMDLLGLMQQLGAIPEPEHSSEEVSPT
jgi:steroid delta-isomerase-like uncharacterized protein